MGNKSSYNKEVSNSNTSSDFKDVKKTEMVEHKKVDSDVSKVTVGTHIGGTKREVNNMVNNGGGHTCFGIGC